MIRRLTVTALFLLISAVGLTQQDKTTLEKNKNRIEEDIRYNQQLLNATTKDKNKSLSQVIILKDNIKKRENLLDELNKEAKRIEQEIRKQTIVIDTLQRKLKRLRDEYTKMILIAQKTGNSFTQIAFIFAAEDFNQAYLRMRYMRQLSEARRQQVMQIEAMQQKLNDRLLSLQEKNEEQSENIRTVETEREKLAADQKKANAEVQSLETKEKELKKSIAEMQKKAQNLEKAIQKLIEDEIRKAEATRRTNNAPTTKNSDFALTPKEVALSKDFTENRGKIPWPVERGIIASDYGEHPHPALKNVQIKNNGIDIITSSGSSAMAVFAGTVSGVWKMPGYNNIIMIRHGDFITVYSKLESVLVKIGDEVSLRQKLGKIHTDAVSEITELHFELWKGKTLQDPALWLLPNN
jgi:septal ring factor EnvC (AmiA/AmiB activator)